MKFAILASATLVTQAVTQGYNVQSNGFRLIIASSPNDSLDGHALGACHQGAAHERLRLTNDIITTPARPFTTFYHNTTSYNHDDLQNANDTAGILNWPLRFNNGAGSESSAMALHYSLTPYLMDMIFAPGNSSYQMVYFEEGSSSMYLAIGLDDTGSVPAFSIPPIKVSNWYVCTTRYNYAYPSLVWNMGLMLQPNDRSCSKIYVQRFWV